MTRYYIYFPFFGAKSYHVVRATGMDVPRMERFSRSVKNKVGQEVRRIPVSEVSAHLRAIRATGTEDAGAFLSEHFRSGSQTADVGTDLPDEKTGLLKTRCF